MLLSITFDATLHEHAREVVVHFYSLFCNICYLLWFIFFIFDTFFLQDFVWPILRSCPRSPEGKQAHQQWWLLRKQLTSFFRARCSLNEHSIFQPSNPNTTSQHNRTTDRSVFDIHHLDICPTVPSCRRRASVPINFTPQSPCAIEKFLCVVAFIFLFQYYSGTYSVIETDQCKTSLDCFALIMSPNIYLHLKWAGIKFWEIQAIN